MKAAFTSPYESLCNDFRGKFERDVPTVPLGVPSPEQPSACPVGALGPAQRTRSARGHGGSALAVWR